MSLQVGWVGVGKMGEAMVERVLDAGFPVAAWNRSVEKLDGVVARGATVAATPSAAAESDIVFSMVLDDAALAALYERSDGVLDGRARVWVDCSSVSPTAAAAAAAAAAERGVAFVSAPVSGNPGVVRAGNLIFAASGPESAIDAAEPVLNAIGRAVHRVGDGAQATVVKICTNAMLGVLMQAVSEVLVLGEAAGVRRSDLLAFMNDSAVGSPFLKYKTAPLTSLDFAATFTPTGMKKDLLLALNLSAAAGSSMPLVQSAEEQFARLADIPEWSAQDIAVALALVAKDSGRTLSPEG